MNKSRLTIGVAGCVAMTLILSVIIAPQAAQALTNDKIFNYRGTDRDQLLVDGARKEGTVVLYSSMIVNQVLRPIAEAFHKKYPFIDVKYWRGAASDIVAKVDAETRANALVADVVEGSGISGGVGESRVAAPFISKYSAVLPAGNIAPDRTWITTRFRYIALGYNTRLISKTEAPKTYRDLLNPKWRGKMAWAVGSPESGALVTITALRAAWGDAKTEAYLAKLARQQVAPLALSNRAVMDRVIAGEYWIGIGISAHHPIISASKGAPSATVLLDPVPALNDAVQVLKGAKHPYAAMLLVDFLLSPDGQTILRNADYIPSNPKVPPKKLLLPIVPKNAGVGQIAVTAQMLLNATPKSALMFQKYFR